MILCRLASGGIKGDNMILGTDAIVISVDDARTLLKAIELNQVDSSTLYKQLAEGGLLDVYSKLLSSVKTIEENGYARMLAGQL